MFKVGDIVEIIETGKVGEIIDVSSSSPPSYSVEWKDDDGWDWGGFLAEDLKKVSTYQTA